MNEQKIIEAMAQKDGYQWITPYDGLGQWNNKNLEQVDNLPDYLTDNEIDRMVRGLVKDDPDMYDNYLSMIEWVTRRDNTFMLCATAPQKCEALLRMEGTWTKEME